MKPQTPKCTYASPRIMVSHLEVETQFCQSGNLPDKLNEISLFEEEFNS